MSIILYEPLRLLERPGLVRAQRGPVSLNVHVSSGVNV